MMVLEVKDDFLSDLKEDYKKAISNWKIATLTKNNKNRIHNHGKAVVLEKVLKGLNVSQEELDLMAINANKKAEKEFNGALLS